MMLLVKALLRAGIATAGLLVIGSGSALATELYSGNTTLGKGTKILASMEGGSSSNFGSTGGTVLETCTSSVFNGELTEAAPNVRLAVIEQTTNECTEPIKVFALATGEIQHIAGTDNGTVFGSGGHVEANVFTSGTPCSYSFGEKTLLGTLTGKTGLTEHATMDIDAIVIKVTGGILCPSSARWISAYTVTSPTGLNVRAS